MPFTIATIFFSFWNKGDLIANGVMLCTSSTMSLMTKWIRSAVLEKLCIFRFTTVVELLMFVVISSRFFNKRGKLLFKVSKVIAISLAVRHICKRMGIQIITSRRKTMPNIIKTISRYMDFLLIPILNQSAIFVGSVVGFLNVFVRNGLKPFPTLLLAASISSSI
jgi:hypothetical protein